jgi:hypothetical protein
MENCLLDVSGGRCIWQDGKGHVRRVAEADCVIGTSLLSQCLPHPPYMDGSSIIKQQGNGVWHHVRLSSIFGSTVCFPPISDIP